MCIRDRAHGPELVDHEGLSVEAQALLPENRSTWRIYGDDPQGQYTDHTGGRDLLQFCRAIRSSGVWRSGAVSYTHLTNIGNLNRDIKAANRMMNAIRSTIKNLRNWIADIVAATRCV